MLDGRMTIGQVAKRAGVNADTLRFYERQGIIAPARRNDANYRVYEEDAVRRVRFVKHAQGIGFSLAEIKELLGLHMSRDARCSDVRDKAMAKIEDLDNRMRSLQDMRRVLEDLTGQCPGNGTPASECPILDALDE